jgi:Ca2+-binding RTX toxin-like protein
MAITFYGFEFVVNGVSDNDYAGAATGLADGGFVLTYASYPAYAYMNRTYDALGNSLAGPLSAGTVNGGVASKNGGIAQLSNGMLVEVFSQTGPGAANPIDVAVTTFPSDLSSFPTPVNPANPYGYEADPTVASSPSGGSIVVWLTDNSVYGRPGYNIVAQIFDNNLAGGTAFVVSEPALSGGDQFNPDAASLTNGNYVVTWQDDSGLDGSGSGIRARVFSTTGAALSPEIAVNQVTGLSQVTPVIAGLAGDRFVVVWENQGDIAARIFNAAGAPLTGDIAVAQFTAGGQSVPDVTALADGGFLVAWTTAAIAPADGGDASGSSIKARGFSSVGAPTGDEILVNSVTTGDQIEPALATLADGRVVVSWTDKSNVLLQSNDVRAQILDPRVQGVTVVGTAGADKYVGSAFADSLSGLGDADQLFGGGGNDTLNGGAGADTMSGGTGDDFYDVDDAADQVIELAGEGAADWVFASVSYALAVGAEVERMTTSNTAGSAAINLTGSGSVQLIQGNQGANMLDGKGGGDTLQGFGGDDLYFVDNGSDHVVEAAGQGNDRVLASVSYTLAAGVDIERLTTTFTAGTQAIDLTGNGVAQTIQGNAGANILDGKGGADYLQGFAGGDLYYVDNAGDKVVEAAGQGNDRVLSSVDYVLAAGQEIERLTTTNSAGTSAIDLTGNEFGQTVQGNQGDNIIDGKAGGDYLQGFAGDDLYYVDIASDRALEAVGGGNDRVLASASYALYAGSEVERLTTTDSSASTAINLTGNEFAQTIQGNAGSNALRGQGGIDTLQGFGGNDTYFVGADTDTVIDSGGFDTLSSSITRDLNGFAGIERLVLEGSADINGIGNGLDNAMYGNSGRNNLQGGAGADTLVGGLGRDAMGGGSGNDMFDFNAAAETGITASTRDKIGDFVHGQDKIDLSTIDANGALAGDAFTFIGVAGFNHAAGELRYVQIDNANNALDETIIEADIDGNGIADFQIGLTGLVTLSAGDFVL